MDSTRSEYTTIFCELLSTPIYQGLASIYDIALQHRNTHEKSNDEIVIFKEFLKNIVPRWSDNIVQKEVTRIKEVTKQGHRLELLFRATLKSHIALLTSTDKFSLTTQMSDDYWKTPNFEKFIHDCYIFSSREIYQVPYVFRDTNNLAENRQNQQEVMHIIKTSIQSVIRSILPLEEIIKEYLYNTQTINKKIFTNTISLLDEEGNNQMEKVFSTYNIKETTPRLINSTASATTQKAPPSEKVPLTASKLTGGGAASNRSTTQHKKSNTVRTSEKKSTNVSHHTITNFLMNDPNMIKSESILQSPIMEED